MRNSAFRKLLSATLLLPMLSGCELLRAPQPEVAPPAPVYEPPIVSDRFLLDSAEQRVVGELQVINARAEDTFVDIARAYSLGFDELVEANPKVDPWLPGEGTPVVLPTRFILPDVPHEGIVINIAAKRLFYFIAPAAADEPAAVVTFPIGIGREGSATPVGRTTVTGKGRNPVWFPPASIRREYAAAGTPLPAQVPPGPDNPLGKHVLLLGMPSYLIHGTNRPAGVGMRVSHGCVRLFPENIEHLFAIVPVGTSVTITNEPWLVAWHEGQLLLEAHTPLSDDDRDWMARLDDLLAAELPADLTVAAVDTELAAAVAAAATGMPLAVSPGGREPAAVVAESRRVNNLAEPLVTELALTAAD
ncbi:MAG: L,D-transpeptidase family protein [Gammaproteobacteria bacterium]|jgi:L,D-transpeptidase ErfK/SrfK|nr:L,D-transpeptidase family protein [Gammaproteobacteria bacterium]